MSDLFDRFERYLLNDAIDMTNSFKGSHNGYLVLREIFFSNKPDVNFEQAYCEIIEVNDYYEEVIKPSISDIVFYEEDGKRYIKKQMVLNLSNKESAKNICALIKESGEYKVYDKHTYVIKAIKDLIPDKIYKSIMISEAFK
ncbi:hypothetical protein [Staphylococcus phage vB_StaM_SA1]|nr:hypothetical protein [Staphylococcus phage vB_StaM_SA1]